MTRDIKTLNPGAISTGVSRTPTAAPAEGRSGTGSDTAFQEMLRTRQMTATSDDVDGVKKSPDAK